LQGRRGQIYEPIQLQQSHLLRLACCWTRRAGPGPRTISSLHIGQTSFVLLDLDRDGPPRLMFEARSCGRSERDPEAGGEADDEFMDSVLSEGAKGLAVRWTWWAAGDCGGARPFPLPRIRPPPSLRPDMLEGGRRCVVDERGCPRQRRQSGGRRQGRSRAMQEQEEESAARRSSGPVKSPASVTKAPAVRDMGQWVADCVSGRGQ
jgi:hypothetical protein